MKVEDMMQMQHEAPGVLSRQTILSTVTGTIESLVQDWDLDQSIDADTRLVADLGFESIDLIQMVAALEQEFGRPNISFSELLIADGRYVDDLTIQQIADALADRVLPHHAAQ
jgi:acyl carrier protein